MIGVRKDSDGRVYVETFDDTNQTTYTQWCQVLGEPGVNLEGRAEWIALALRVLNSLRGTPGISVLVGESLCLCEYCHKIHDPRVACLEYLCR